MAIVGPRPNVIREVQKYTNVERKMLSVKPGITDLSSIIFRNLGDMLKGYKDANIAYNDLIRPLKSRFSLFCIENKNIYFNISIILLTPVSIINSKISDMLIKYTT